MSRRERQIMDIIYRLGPASATQVRGEMEDPPSYSAVRALLKVLEGKGHLTHESEGPRHLFRPTVSREQASQSALNHVVRTFFEGSTERAVAALLDLDTAKLRDEDYERLRSLIDEARAEEER